LETADWVKVTPVGRSGEQPFGSNSETLDACRFNADMLPSLRRDAI
jgi:hypothetical protein